jgi:hypothetical protein
MTKFMAGPTIGVVAGMPTLWTVVMSVLGMMTSVLIFTLIGEYRGYPRITRIIDQIQARRGVNRYFNYIWQKVGIIGVIFLTPVFFTPIIGTILVNAMGSPRAKIIIYMFFSAIFWSITLSKIAQVVV